jgi:ribonucleoside-diphosphate reductase alpha chain
MEFLDNVLEDFIQRAPEEMGKAVMSALSERSVGLGVMGFHSLLQKKRIAFEGAMAKAMNLNIFKHIKRRVDEADHVLAITRGSCWDAEEAGEVRRFSNTMAIAPTASISVICGGTSAGIEPIPANIYTHKTLSGSFTVKNPYLDRIIKDQCLNYYSDQGSDTLGAYNAIWNSILENEGSVQHLDWLSPHDKAVFKTAFELDQRWLVEFAADRQPCVSQAQSLNLYVPADIQKHDLHWLHFKGWETGVKSFYYLRSKSLARAGFAGGVEKDNTIEPPRVELANYEECLSCQ